MEELLIPATVIISSVFAIWLITSSKFRKQIGNDVSATIHHQSASMVDAAKLARARAKLDAIQDLEDDGLDKVTVATRMADFDELFGSLK